MNGGCLNCGATLIGRFCASCGQRVVPPHPTVRELIGDAWRELSGYDGRIAATFRGLMKPGLLTRRYLDGQRARYLAPVRLYLFVSVLYFLVAAAAPSLDSADGGRTMVGPGIRIGVTGGRLAGQVSPEEREQLLKELETSPWLVRPMLQAIAASPEGFRARLFTIMPRVFFAMLPVFAAIVALFYRGRTFPTSLVFAVHLHAFAFVALTISEASKFTGSRIVAAVVGGTAFVVLAVYVFMAFRAMFGGGILRTMTKLAAIAVIYFIASLPAFFIILMWAAIT